MLIKRGHGQKPPTLDGISDWPYYDPRTRPTYLLSSFDQILRHMTPQTQTDGVPMTPKIDYIFFNVSTASLFINGTARRKYMATCSHRIQLEYDLVLWKNLDK